MTGVVDELHLRFKRNPTTRQALLDLYEMFILIGIYKAHTGEKFSDSIFVEHLRGHILTD